MPTQLFKRNTVNTEAVFLLHTEAEKEVQLREKSKNKKSYSADEIQAELAGRLLPILSKIQLTNERKYEKISQTIVKWDINLNKYYLEFCFEDSELGEAALVEQRLYLYFDSKENVLKIKAKNQNGEVLECVVDDKCFTNAEMIKNVFKNKTFNQLSAIETHLSVRKPPLMHIADIHRVLSEKGYQCISPQEEEKAGLIQDTLLQMLEACRYDQQKRQQENNCDCYLQALKDSLIREAQDDEMAYLLNSYIQNKEIREEIKAYIQDLYQAQAPLLEGVSKFTIMCEGKALLSSASALEETQTPLKQGFIINDALEKYRDYIQLNRDTLIKRRDSKLTTFLRGLGAFGASIIGLQNNFVSFFHIKVTQGANIVNDVDALPKQQLK